MSNTDREVCTLTQHMTPAEAWEGFVGSQTPSEFMEISHQKGLITVEAAVNAYVQDFPAMFNLNPSERERSEIVVLLTEYIVEQVPGVDR